MPRRVVIKKSGGVSAIDVQSMDMPTPGKNQIRIRVVFAGINFADLLMRMGFYNPRPPYPFTPGYEMSGYVDALGEGVTSFTIGQRVVAAMRNGGQTSHAICDTSRVILLPEDISLEAAAATPVVYLTAHHMLHHLGHIEPEHSVLIHGGAGGVGIAALQLCNWAGVERVWATSSASKHNIIEQYGAKAIDRHNEDFVEIIRRETEGRGVDHVLDPIGGEHLKRSLSVVAEGGRLYTYGLSAAAPTSKRSRIKALLALRKTPKFDPLRLMTRNRSVFGVHMGTWTNEAVMQRQLNRIIEGIQEGHLKPTVDRIFPAEEVQKAHQFIHDAKNIGKVLLKFSEIEE